MASVCHSVNDQLNNRTTHKDGAFVRSNNEQRVVKIAGHLTTGEVASVVELGGRRARIIVPLEGWISATTQDGTQVCTEGERQQCGVEVPVTLPANVPTLPPEQMGASF